MRWETIALAGMLVLAGCIGASASVQDAESLEDVARDAADDHIDEPRLVAAFGMEPPAHLEDKEEGAEVFIHLDDDPGDGQAPGWAYHFVGTDRQAFLLVNDAIGVIAEAYFPLDEDRDHVPVVIEGWEVGSQEAAEILRADERWPAANESHLVVWELEMTEEGPVWAVELSEGGAFFDDGVRARVSAQNGTILAIQEENDSFDGFPEDGSGHQSGCESGATGGLVTPLRPLEVPITLEGVGSIQADASAQGGGLIELAIEHASGEPVDRDEQTAVGATGATAMADQLPPGDYWIVVESQAGAFQVNLIYQAGFGGGCGGQHHQEDEALGTGPFDAWARAQFEAWLTA